MSSYKLSPISQKEELCWEACGKMLWEWKHNANTAMKGNYNNFAGMYFLMKKGGLNSTEMTKFYKRLGLRSYFLQTGKGAKGHNVTHALKWSPVIVTTAHGQDGHAIIVIGHENGKYRVLDPCHTHTMNFETGANQCQAGETLVPDKEFDAALEPNIWYW